MRLEALTIYDAKGLVKQLLNKEIDIEQVVVDAQSLFQIKAAQLGKLGVWHRAARRNRTRRVYGRFVRAP